MNMSTSHSLTQRQIVALVFLCFMLGACDLPTKRYRVPTRGMEPTIVLDQIILVRSLDATTHPVAYGDIISFRSLQDPDTVYLKRVVGLEGDTVELADTTLIRNDQPVDEPYAVYSATLPNFSRDFGPVTVPEDHVFLLGDNRDGSADSRRYGPVPLSHVLGRYEPDS